MVVIARRGVDGITAIEHIAALDQPPIVVLPIFAAAAGEPDIAAELKPRSAFGPAS